MRSVWIVEMPINGRWVSTVGCALNRDDARWTLRNWRKKLPDEKLRIRRYEPVKK